MTINNRLSGSLLSAPTTIVNFTPQLSAVLTTSGVSGYIAFPVATGTQRQTFCIANKGSYGAYLGWGSTTATAVVSSGTPTAHCHYIPAGAVLTLDFQMSTNIVNAIAAIQDSAATTLEISLGYGQ